MTSPRRNALVGPALGLALALGSSPMAWSEEAPAAMKPTRVTRAPDRWHGADKPYLASVHARIHPRWNDFLRELVRAPPPFQNPLLSVEVEIVVAPDGRVAEIRGTSVSGLAGFDEAPRDLLSDLGALPPPPAGVRSDDDRAHLRWRFGRLEPGCEEFEVIEARLPLEEALARLIGAQREGEAMARLDEARREDAGKARAALPRLAILLGPPAASSSDAATRAAAAGVLARVPTGEPLLMKLATDGDAAVRRAAIEALGTPPRTTAGQAVLLGALGGAELELRGVAARSLGRLGDKAAVPPLLDALGKSVAPMESAVALRQLGEAERASALIVAQLAGKGPSRLAGALAAAGLADPRLGGKVATALSGASEETRAALVDAVAATGRETAPEGRKLLVKALHDSSPKVRARACAALQVVGDKSARARLVEALADPAPPVRAAAVAALVEVGGAANVDELAHAAVDKAAAVRSVLAMALAAHPFEGSDKILARLADDKEASVKAAATTPSPASKPADPSEPVTAIVRADGPAARLRALAAALQ